MIRITKKVQAINFKQIYTNYKQLKFPTNSANGITKRRYKT